MSKKGGVFVATYFSFNDALIQAYTLPYVRQIRKFIPKPFPIYLLTVEKDKNFIESIRDEKNRLASEGITLINLHYQKFGLGLLTWIPSFIFFIFIIGRKNIQTIHAWCTPGGLIGYMLSILTGKRLILDSFEPHAEVMKETKTWRESSLKFKTLFKFEKWMAKRASIHICCTQDMKEYSLKKYGVLLKDNYVKPACVDLLLYPENYRKDKQLLLAEGLQDKIVCVYAGKFGGLYLSEEVFDFLSEAYQFWGDRFRILLLSNESSDIIQQWADRSNIPNSIILQKFVPHAEVPKYLGLADFGLAPYQPVPSRKYGAPIKVSEYWASGLPVVITANIADDSKTIIENGIGAVLNGLNTTEYKKAVEAIDALLLQNYDLSVYSKIRYLVGKRRNYGIAAQVYQNIYE